MFRTNRRARRKGDLEFSIAYLGIEITVLVILLFSLNKAISSMIQPNFQIAYANAELLRSTIDGLCEQGSGEISLENWNFPQPQPMTVDAAGQESFKSVLPKFMIKARGDPHFLIYYEAYPPPQAFGWELYQSLGERMLTPVRSLKDVPQATRFITDLVGRIRQQTGVQTVLIPNIILGNKSDETILGSVGKWGSENIYALSGYDLLPELAKSSVKYRACGDYTLCMKTRESVIKMDLPNCRKNKIDYVQMYRETSDVFESMGEDVLKGLGVDYLTYRSANTAGKILQFVGGLLKSAPKVILTTAGKLVSGIGAAVAIAQAAGHLEELAANLIALFQTSSSDFGLASPCKLSMDVTVGECDCNTMQTLKLFEYDNATDSLKVVGDYNTCWDQITGATGLTGEEKTIRCIKVGLRDEYGFCTTRNVVLPFTDFFSTSFGHAAKYSDRADAVELLPGTDKVRPGTFGDFESGWVWPGQRTGVP